MEIIGDCIARRLKDLKGLYSVEIPEGIVSEGHALVRRINSVYPNRALFVTEDTTPITGVKTIRWRDLLGWRTEDDRIFVWKRGLREPDSSFRSVVRPFVSSRFPGTNGGECGLELLIELSIQELWWKRNIQPVGDSYEAFLETAQWVGGIIRLMFERSGSQPGAHWSDGFLLHWAKMLNAVDLSWTAFGGAVDPRHAWELVRISGLPLPSEIAEGNPFLTKPKHFEEKHWDKFAELWADIVTSFILPKGAIAAFLTVLDKQTLSANAVTPWRQLSWNLVDTLPSDSSAPCVGLTVFGSSPSPSLFSPDLPSYPITPIPAWWGVSSSDLNAARQQLREQTPLVPDDTTVGLLRTFSSDPTPYILNTRGAVLVEPAHTAKKWRIRLTVNDIALKYKESWNHLHVSAIEPD